MYYQLHVRVIEADDIPRMDLNKTDAYCILQAGSETQNTFAIMNCMHPRWNQDFHFNVTTPTAGSLHIMMRDKDLFKDDNISYIDIPFCSFPLGQIVDQWYYMTPYHHYRKGGRLHLLVQMGQAGQPPFVPQMPVYAVQSPVYQYAASPYPAPGYYAQPGYQGYPGYPGYPCY
ncbi:hypothetical protein M9Y10_007200 [Tritrichomonas musculus]|uniref:C2 domain-containing protein n=1 Tax=Tritrichomonas musculus TaxID=1915356 RepID=A0ABR2J0Q8_9EUKA